MCLSALPANYMQTGLFQVLTVFVLTVGTLKGNVHLSFSFSTVHAHSTRLIPRLTLTAIISSLSKAQAWTLIRNASAKPLKYMQIVLYLSLA